MPKQLIFIDDSGDPGFKSASSSNLVMSAAIFVDSETAEQLTQEMNQYRKSLGWKYNHEFKFTKNPKAVIIELLHRINKYDFKIYAVYIKKHDFRKIGPALVHFLDHEKLYNWSIKELLQDIPLDTAKITIDGRSSKQNMNNTKTYLRRELSDGTKKLEIKFEDSVATNLLQLADLISGSINRSLQPDKTDHNDYISILKNKIVKIRKITLK